MAERLEWCVVVSVEDYVERREFLKVDSSEWVLFLSLEGLGREVKVVFGEEGDEELVDLVEEDLCLGEGVVVVVFHCGFGF